MNRPLFRHPVSRVCPVCRAASGRPCNETPRRPGKR
ncbi:hypothetical protein [Paenibacillus chitinolyticus]